MVGHSSHLNKILAVALGCALAGSAATGTTSSARADGPDAEAVTIDTTFTVMTPPVRLENPANNARASVVLMTGGNGLLSLDGSGTIINSTGNFLIRSANLFLQHGLNVMMADVALAYPSGMNLSDRLSAMHAAELQGFVTAALIRWGKPVWVVGTSNGSVSAVTAAGFTPALSGLRGVVLTSPVTQLPTADQPTFNLYVSRITLPTLVVWNQDDHCAASPPAGSAALLGNIPSSTKASDVFQGGHSVATDPCGAFSEHGYAGIAHDVVKEIAQFIKQTK
jgi:pimeloyl-ACP methyl ester carboxylesterase